jgi:hypothetical protein
MSFRADAVGDKTEVEAADIFLTPGKFLSNMLKILL